MQKKKNRPSQIYERPSGGLFHPVEISYPSAVKTKILSHFPDESKTDAYVEIQKVVGFLVGRLQSPPEINLKANNNNIEEIRSASLEFNRVLTKFHRNSSQTAYARLKILMYKGIKADKKKEPNKKKVPNKKDFPDQPNDPAKIEEMLSQLRAGSKLLSLYAQKALEQQYARRGQITHLYRDAVIHLIRIYETHTGKKATRVNRNLNNQIKPTSEALHFIKACLQSHINPQHVDKKSRWITNLIDDVLRSSN